MFCLTLYFHNSKIVMQDKKCRRRLVGETVNSQAFHACIHGFESRTSHHYGKLAKQKQATNSNRVIAICFPSFPSSEAMPK